MPNISRENLERVLRDHWLAGIHCDHEAKTDKPSCSCSMWNCPPQPTIGAAAERWIEHVLTKCDDLAAIARAADPGRHPDPIIDAAERAVLGLD